MTHQKQAEKNAVAAGTQRNHTKGAGRGKDKDGDGRSVEMRHGNVEMRVRDKEVC